MMSASAFAGTPVVSSKEVVPPPADPCLFTWFAGGSVGYLTEFEEPMYHLHVGTDTCWSLGGWNIAFFGEIGYTDKDESYRPRETSFPPLEVDNGDSLDLDELGTFLGSLANQYGPTSYDLRIIPITANIKFEREIATNLGVYVGAGIGAANVDLEVKVRPNTYSDDDWVFVAQAFAGLVYNVTPAFEVYGGARYIYFGDADLSDGGYGGTLELDDDVLLELGARYNF